MLVTIISKRTINGNYNYRVQDSQGNRYIIKDSKNNLELNKQYDIQISAPVKQQIQTEETKQIIKTGDYWTKTFGMTRQEIDKHMETFRPVDRGRELALLMVAHERSKELI